MESKQQNTPLIVIVGPTASGKSALAMEIARRFKGEIICADSRTVYKGMDIGTAKPSPKEQAEIPHHLLDVVSPDEKFTAAEFKRLALQAIELISSRGNIPIIVGGTGLYIDGVIFDYAFLPPGPTEEREALQQMSVPELQAKIGALGLRLPENDQNPRHLIRTIETNGAVAVRKGMREHTLIMGVEVGKDELTARIEKRVSQMIELGLEKEVDALAEKYGWEASGLSAVGYREWNERIAGSATEQEVMEAITSNSMQYAKRQRTWFRRNPDLIWIKNSSEATKLVQDFLQQNTAN